MSPRPAEEVAALVGKAEEHWRKRASRLTPVRKIVCETVFAASAPLDAETVLARARAVDRLISHATVYRTLGHLVEAGLLREVSGPRGQRFYAVVDAPAAGMSHVVCRDCQQVIPLADPCLPLREGALTRQMGFQPRSMNLRVEADCREFHEKGSCSRRARPEGAGA